MQKILLAALLVTGCLFIASCDKDPENPSDILHGLWKTSYGDTIRFSTDNGRNLVHYDVSMNPSLPMTSDHEYRYKNGKFFLNRMPGTPYSEYQQLKTFKWLEKGKSFQIQGVEWFIFLSSTQTNFSFTRIY